MKISNQSLDSLLGAVKTARHTKDEKRSLDSYFKNPIIHKQISGERVYVPLNINRVWNEV